MPADDDQAEHRRLVTVDVVPGVGEVVTYAVTDHARLRLLAAAAPSGVDYEATWGLLERATTYVAVREGRRGASEHLDAFATEAEARAYVRGMVRAVGLEMRPGAARKGGAR